MNLSVIFSTSKAILLGLCASGSMYYGWSTWQAEQMSYEMPPMQVQAASSIGQGHVTPPNTPAASSSAPTLLPTPSNPSTTPPTLSAAPLPVAAPPASILPTSTPDLHRFSRTGTLQVDGALGNAFLMAGQESTAHVMLTLTGSNKQTTTLQRAPLDLFLVIDRSGSMKGKRLQGAKEAASLLIAQLEDGDRVSIVTYSNRAETLLHSTLITPSTQRLAFLRIAEIKADGGTCISCGLLQAQTLASHRHISPSTSQLAIQRIVLLSDGKPDPDHGQVTINKLLAISSALERSGVTTSTVGLGLNYNEWIMRNIASSGNGNHYFAERPEELALKLSSELAVLNDLVARQVIATFTLPQGVRFLEGFDRTFRVDEKTRTVQVPIGDIPRGAKKTILFKVNVNPIQSQIQQVAQVSLQYGDIALGKREHINGNLSMRITHNPQDLSAGKDPIVFARVEQAEINESLRLINNDIRSGNVRGAQHRLRRQIKRSKKKNRTWGNKKLSDNLRNLEDFDMELGSVQNPSHSPETAKKSAHRAAKGNAARITHFDE